MNPINPMSISESSALLKKEIQTVTTQHQQPLMFQENSPSITKHNLGSPKSSMTPRLARKNSAMEVVKEDDEDQLITTDDEEIAELTSTGIIRNKSASFTNLVSNMQSPSPSRSRGSTHPEEIKGNKKEKIFFLETENNSPGEGILRCEEISRIKGRSQSLPESNTENNSPGEGIPRCEEISR